MLVRPGSRPGSTRHVKSEASVAQEMRVKLGASSVSPRHAISSLRLRWRLECLGLRPSWDEMSAEPFPCSGSPRQFCIDPVKIHHRRHERTGAATETTVCQMAMSRTSSAQTAWRPPKYWDTLVPAECVLGSRDALLVGPQPLPMSPCVDHIQFPPCRARRSGLQP